MSYTPAPTSDPEEAQYPQKTGGPPPDALQGMAPSHSGGGVPQPVQYPLLPRDPSQYPPSQPQPNSQPQAMQIQPNSQPQPMQPQPNSQPQPMQPQPNFQPQQPGYYIQSQPMQAGPGGYYAGQQPFVVQMAPGMSLMNQRFGEVPVTTTCPNCHAEVTTTTEYVSGGLTWIVCGVLFVMGFCLLIPWFLCCIPCCISACRDVVHYCPNCNARIGMMKRV